MATTAAPTRTPWSAITLGVIGVAHTALTPVLYRTELAGIARDGVLDRIERDPATKDARAAAFWFAQSGAAMVLIAGLSARAERSPAGVPRFLAPALTGIATVGVTLMPRSGFWALYVPAALARRARR